MNIGICNLSIIPLRRTASHRSEMVSQVLFGEYFEILDDQGEWVFVRLIDVPYEGWIVRGQFEMVDFELYKANLDYKNSVVDITGAEVWKNNRMLTTLLPGTLVSEVYTQGNSNIPYFVHGNLRTPRLGDFETEFPKLINYYINSPYLWGGRSHLGIDCSGFSQALYRHLGVKLLRDAYQQAEEGSVVDFLTEVKSGDLAFFDNEQGNITHVGVMLDNEYIIHASAKVRIDRMDSQGIFNKDYNRYTHKLRIVKRYF